MFFLVNIFFINFDNKLFFLPTFSTNVFFLTFGVTNYLFLFFSSSPPPQISNGASLSKAKNGYKNVKKPPYFICFCSHMKAQLIVSARFLLYIFLSSVFGKI